MPRQKLSEYKSKVLVSEALELQYTGWSVNYDKPLDVQLKPISGDSLLVVKVDQGIKGRFKKGLVALNVSLENIEQELNKLHEKGYNSFIIEPQIDHEQSDEKYLAIAYDRYQQTLSFCRSGGVDIESNASLIEIFTIDGSTDWEGISSKSGFSQKQLQSLVAFFDDNFVTLLEINPYIIKDGNIRFLDIAMEVDDSGGYFVDTWSHNDFRRSSSKQLTHEEVLVRELDDNSPASLKLEVLNPDGSIFLLLSGGGASVVVADEVYNLGLGDELANYGEYSGNPNSEETYLYTKALLELMLASKANQKVLFIGGAVANFTDIANTFTGIIQAIEELHEKLISQNIKVFVRRGGPRQEIGLEKINSTLKKHNLLGAVHDPSTPLTQVVAEAVGVVS